MPMSSRPRQRAVQGVIAIAAGIALFAPGRHADAAVSSGNAALTSDYVWRGISQTQGDPAAQAGLRIANASRIGRILSPTIALETGGLARFATVGDYVSYCRLVKSERVSNSKKKGQGNRRCGNKYLGWAWIEAANFALRYSPPIKRWYDRKAARRHRVIRDQGGRAQAGAGRLLLDA